MTRPAPTTSSAALSATLSATAAGLAQRFASTRAATRRLIEPLSAEDCQVQSMPDASPAKWHLAHTTWYFETFVLGRQSDYRPFHPAFRHLFNSYYVAVGPAWSRPARGLLTRPSLEQVLEYREHVDSAMQERLERGRLDREALWAVELGLAHEEQHQELLVTDVKHLLAMNPLLPSYRAGAGDLPGRDVVERTAKRGAHYAGTDHGAADPAVASHAVGNGTLRPHAASKSTLRSAGGQGGAGGRGGPSDAERKDGGGGAGGKDGAGYDGAGNRDGAPALRWHPSSGGLTEIGHAGDGFAFDNESPRHAVHLQPFELASRPATNAEWLAFMADDGYARSGLWLSEGFETARARGWSAPLHWIERDGAWHEFTLDGVRPLDPAAPVCHVSGFEADAFARWSAARLPTEAEWEHAARDLPVRGHFADSGRFHPARAPADAHALPAQMFGDVWEWTSSDYAPYPGYRPWGGDFGEYNGKFMCNQRVLRGGSCATPAGHVRATYRNFFPLDARWQFSGVRLARDAR